MKTKLTIAFAADHAGYNMKQTLVAHAQSLGYEVIDFGTDNSEQAVDYPDYVPPVIEAIKSHKANFGVFVCGSGLGMDIAANRDKCIRSALCHCGLAAKYARAHNDANVLCLCSRFIGEEVAKECLEQFIITEFEGGRHERRVNKLGI